MNSAAQIEFDLRAVRPVADDAAVGDFVEFLKGQSGWVSSPEILAGLGRNDGESQRRILRAWAEGAEGEVLSGQKGYCHITRATAEEIHHAASWLESQGKKMLGRGLAIRRRAHGLVG